MGITDFIYEVINGRRRAKPQMLMLGILIAFVIFVFFVLLVQREAAQGRKAPKPFVMQKAPLKRSLDYQIVKVDTIPFSHPTLPGSATSSSPAFPSQSPAGQRSISPSERSERSTPAVAPPPANVTPPVHLGGSSGGGDMIVVSSLDQQQGASTIGSLTGLQSVRLKVILPEKTPVMNGSLVEARVMKDEVWGNIQIPRRSQLLGFCSLQNNRVQIEFREIRIKGVSYTCSGRAYDLKSLPGIPYLPLTAEAKKLVLEELKSAAAGVPILGRYLNRSEINPFTDEVATLDEGLEFYALIMNIF
ncbi:MAG: conjugative transposon protein TraM [candidate division KSB1 bacterium]|nr:conjugative transposon protein TraM [candidate division KSB1 bacterium]MDZ7303231.1 conjugative transposon protein TraM [candidate division KSB1 bacterium]MDZ7312157.1 conjugative transposon protein TraM [candidate division KSB1 bacterium]